MKKPIILIFSLLIVSGLGFYVYKLNSKSGNTLESEFSEFAIKDVSNIDRIIISDELGQKMELIKTNEKWTDAKGGCLQQEGMEHMMNAFKKIKLKGYLPEAAAKHHKKKMYTKHIKVEIFENGSWSKTWYIGSAAQNHDGQIMLLDSKEYGMSDNPVIMQITGLNGIIEPTFYADIRKWECTNIFALNQNQIKKIDVKYVKEPTRSFSIERFGNEMKVFQNNQPLPGVDTSRIFMYLNKYKKIHYLMPNYILNNKQVDSVKKSTPFSILSVEETNGKLTKLKLFRVSSEGVSKDEFGKDVNYDTDEMWCLLPSGKLVKCQYYVMNPLLLGHIYFPLDLRAMSTGEYIIPKPEAFPK
jgi:hypothetical protein